MPNSYYVKVGGEVKGPLTRDDVALQIRRKRLGRNHEVSLDSVAWHRAEDMEDFFPAGTKEPEVSVAATFGPSQPPILEPAKSNSRVHQRAQSDVADEWYYAQGQNSFGPVPATHIREMLATGRLTGTDSVWSPTSTDWRPAAEVPQFERSIRDGGETRRSSAEMWRDKIIFKQGLNAVFGFSKIEPLPTRTIARYPQLRRYLAIAETALRFFFVFQLLGLAAGVLFLTGWSAATYDLRTTVTVAVFGSIGFTILGFVSWFMLMSSLAFVDLVRIAIRVEHAVTKSHDTPSL